MKHLITILLLHFGNYAIGQDSLLVKREFRDGAQKNKLEIKVINPCHLKTPPWDGVKTQIEARLTSRGKVLELIYDYPYPQMSLLYFEAAELKMADIQGAKAVIIPFYYCGNAEDYDRKVSYILFYKQKKYLFHLDYFCKEPAKCKPQKNLNLLFKELPAGLKKYFLDYLNKKHASKGSFHQDYT